MVLYLQSATWVRARPSVRVQRYGHPQAGKQRFFFDVNNAFTCALKLMRTPSYAQRTPRTYLLLTYRTLCHCMCLFFHSPIFTPGFSHVGHAGLTAFCQLWDIVMLLKSRIAVYVTYQTNNVKFLSMLQLHRVAPTHS